MARKLIDIARILRSKNAGPLYVTFDIMFNTRNELDYVLDSGAVNQAVIAVLYGIKTEEVSIIPYAVVNACKITIPRRYISGDIQDDDIYGCQQHLKLANIVIP
ncbi:MAG: DUF4387 domain-containing protein [Bacteroidetes bacterium]|nr:DUF4387 domain-containing protein [Bacteroidota bacterium]